MHSFSIKKWEFFERMKNAPGMHQYPGWTLILISYILISGFCLTFLNDVTLDPSLTGGEEFSSPVNCVAWIEPKFGVVLSRLAGAISRRPPQEWFAVSLWGRANSISESIKLFHAIRSLKVKAWYFVIVNAQAHLEWQESFWTFDVSNGPSCCNSICALFPIGQPLA